METLFGLHLGLVTLYCTVLRSSIESELLVHCFYYPKVNFTLTLIPFSPSTLPLLREGAGPPCFAPAATERISYSPRSFS